MTKIDKDPFSNGTEYMIWEEENCDKCIKSSHIVIKGGTYKETKVQCAVQRDIFTRMCSKEPIAQRTIDATSKAICPYRVTQYPPRKPREDKEQLSLDL